MLHIGQLIACTLHEQGRTVTWFARQLCCTRPNVYKIFGKENIDISLLWRISCILHHDFFGDLSQEMKCDVNFSLPFCQLLGTIHFRFIFSICLSLHGKLNSRTTLN